MKAIKLFLALAILALLPAITWAAPIPGAGLATTAHDFTQGNNAETTVPVGLCTFCHTPHKALSTLLLWNHTLSTNTFTWDVTNTTGGTAFPTFGGSTYAGVTAKCLSCHDGSVAIGDVVLFNENWTGGGTGSVLNPDKHNASDDVFNVGRSGNMAGNHPVAMPYPFGQLSSNYNGSTTGSRVVLTEFQADPSGTCNTTACIRLFNRSGVADPSNGNAGLECSTCHDPHNKASVDDLFLRGKLVGQLKSDGYICLQCHIK